MRNLSVIVAALAIAAAAHADEKTEHAELATKATALAPMMGNARVSLGTGIDTAAREGKPVSASYELEGAKLTLSVYVMKGDTYSQVVIDPSNGDALKSTVLTGGDLATAKKQGEAIARGKLTLRDVVTAAEKAHPGYKAVGIRPEIEKGKPEADVSLLKGASAKVVDWKL